MISDSVANLLTLIRNAQMAKHKSVTVPATKLNRSIVAVLESEGLVGAVRENKQHKFPKIDIELKYFSDMEPLMRSLKRVSKPGCRVYSDVGNLERVTSGLGIALLSTSEGIITDTQARERKVGGEVLALIG